jgi:hypothetical protein
MMGDEKLGNNNKTQIFHGLKAPVSILYSAAMGSHSNSSKMCRGPFRFSKHILCKFSVQNMLFSSSSSEKD